MIPYQISRHFVQACGIGRRPNGKNQLFLHKNIFLNVKICRNEGTLKILILVVNSRREHSREKSKIEHTPYF